MEFAVLGPVLVDGYSPRGAVMRALVARLLVAPGVPVPAAELMEAAWPEEQRGGAAGSLRVRLAKLRGLVEPEREPGRPATVLVREPGGYALRVAPESVDIQRFVHLADEAAQSPAAAALAQCDAALALWRGEPFAELDGVEVARAEARRLHAVRDAVRRRRAAALDDLGRLEEAVLQWRELVAEDPLREELVREFMLSLYRAGRHVESLEAYRTLARRLGELGLQPGPAVRELEALVLRHDHELGRLRPSRGHGAHPTNVGARVASVVGREDDIEAVLAALGAHRIVTLVGPGGVGKTTLAAEVARTAQDELPAGTWLVELAPMRDAVEVMPAVAVALGLRRIGGGALAADGDALALVRERLRDAEALVVLDGAEHLLPGVARAARDLAAAGSGVRVLVTSRRPLAVAGEAVFPVAPLTVPADDAGAGELEDSPAGRLFVERARAARPGWRLGGEEALAVAHICRRLNGLPLALELAASRLRALSVTAIAARLDEGLAVLGRGTLDASIEASHVLLAPAEQELFRRLSIFEGYFGVEDAEQVAAGDGLAREQVLDLLVALTEHSMVQAEGDAPRRYRMLDALRAYARGRLDERALDAAAQRHAAQLARLAAEAAARVGVDGAEAAGEAMVRWRADLEAAFRHALGRRDADLALDLGSGLLALHYRLGTVARGVELLDQALRLGGHPLKRLAALWWHVPMLVCELRVDAATEAFEELRHLIAVHDPDRAAGLRVLEAQLELCAGRLDMADAALRDLPAQLLASGARFTAGIAAEVQGGLALARGALDEGIALLTAARDHHAACNDVCSLDAAVARLAEAARLAGRGREAAAACEDALAFAPRRPLGERNTQLLHEAALAAAQAGRTGRAGLLAQAAVSAARRDPIAIGPWHAPAAQGDLALMAGDLSRAAECYRQALAVAADVEASAGRSLPTSLYLMASELRLATVAEAAGARDAALAHARAALEHARASGAPAALGAAREAVQRLEAAVTPA